MSVYSEQSEPVVVESAFGKIVSALRRRMACRHPKRILAVTVLAVGCVAAFSVIAAVLTKGTDSDALRETDFTTISPPTLPTRIVTEIVPKTTRSDPTSRSSTSASMMSTKVTTASPETSQTTGRASLSTSETTTTVLLSTSEITTAASPPPSTASTTKLSTTTTTTTTTATTTEPTTSTSQPTTGRTTYEAGWKRFLEPELNINCHCEGCSRIPDDEIDALGALREDPPANLWLLDKPGQVKVSCGVIKSMPSAYSFKNRDASFFECIYDRKLLSEYYTQVPELLFPQDSEETWDIPITILDAAANCEEVIAMKQCRELPAGQFFAICEGAS